MNPVMIQLEHPPVTEDSLFRILKMDPGDDEFAGDIRAMFQEASALAVPKGMYALCQVTEKGADFVVAEQIQIKSSLVRKNLDKTDRIVPFVTTCGVELEEWSRTYTDPLEAYWADGIKLLYLHEIRKALSEEIRNRYFPVGDMSVMTPGSLPAWPLPAQKRCFPCLAQ